MPAIDWNGTCLSMVDAAAGSLGKDWPEVRDYVSTALEQYMLGIRRVSERLDAHLTTRQMAEDELAQQRFALGCALSSAKGMCSISAEKAINAALGIVKSVLNTAIGFEFFS